MNTLRPLLSLFCACLLAGWSSAAGTPALRRVLFIVGPSGHPPGTHEAAASARLLKHCVNQVAGGMGLETQIVEGWPSEPRFVDGVKTIVFTGDMFPPYRFANQAGVFARLIELAEKGTSIVCVHYATSVNDARNAPVPPTVLADLSRLLGGFGHFLPGNVLPGTQARIMDLTVSPTDSDHPVLHGVKPFSLRDEPYFPIRFDRTPPPVPVTILATAAIPPEQPAVEAVAWSMDRGGGSRSVSVLFPHFYANWRDDQLRKLVVNGILWATGAAVPAAGYDTTLPPLETFEPVSVTPRPRTQP